MKKRMKLIKIEIMILIIIWMESLDIKILMKMRILLVKRILQLKWILNGDDDSETFETFYVLAINMWNPTL